MSFKEKIAWISVVTTILVWGAYFWFVVAGARWPGPVYTVGFTGAVVVQTILMIAASVVTAVMSPKEASAASDERDKAIARRAYAFAYPVLLGLIVCVAACVHLGARPWDLVNGMMGAIVIAEIVHYAAQIAGYRRGY